MEKFNNLWPPVHRPEKTTNPINQIINEAELIKIENINKNEAGLFLAEDGSVSHYQNDLYWKIIKTKSFREWFKDSVAAYEDNQEPLMVFHSTLKKEITGSNLKLNEKTDDWNSYGIYFSSNKQATINFYENQYQDDVNRFNKLLSDETSEKEDIVLDKEKYFKQNEKQVKTFCAFIKLVKPLKLKSHDELMEISLAGFSRNELLKEHDGIIVENDSDFSDQYIVFKEDNVLIIPSETT